MGTAAARLPGVEFPGRVHTLEITRIEGDVVTVMRWNGPYQMDKEMWTRSAFRKFIKDRKLTVLP